MKVYINGNLVEKNQAKISVFDHGFLYGDGVFEGIRSYKCLVFKLREHIDRLYESAHSICLRIPQGKQELSRAIINTLKANKLKDAYIRVVVSRGSGDLGLDPRKRYICFTGNLAPWQGLIHMMDAMPLILKERNNAVFLVVGGGREK